VARTPLTAASPSVTARASRSSRASRLVWGDGEGWQLSAEPILDIGVVEGDPAYQLDQVTDAVLTPAGDIIVANAGSQEIRVFDPDGRIVRTLGRMGEGPGEFQALSGVLVRPADTIMAFDQLHRSVTVFDPTGSVTRSAILGEGIPMGAPGALDDGSLVVASMALDETIADLRTRLGAFARPPASLVRYRLDDPVPDTIGVFPGLEFTSSELPGAGVGVTVPLFGRQFTFAARGDHVYLGTGDGYEIRIHASDHSLVRIVRRSDVDLQITEAARDSAMADILSAMDPELRPMWEELLPVTPVAPQRAPYGDIQVDALGYLWVSDFYHGSYRTPPPPSGWAIFDPEGCWLGEMTVPDGFRVFEVGEDYVLGVQRDELDVEHVRMYGLER